MIRAMTDPFTADDLLGLQTPEVRALTQRLRDLMRETAPEAEETPQKGWKTLSYRTGRGIFAFIAPHKAHVDLGFYEGADLPDPEGVLEGTGKKLRHVKIRSDVDIRPDAFAALIRAAWELHQG